MAFEYLVRSYRIWRQNGLTYTIVSLVYLALLYSLFVDISGLASFLPSTGWWNLVSVPAKALLFFFFIAFGSILNVSIVKMSFEELADYSYIDKVFSGLKKKREAVAVHVAAAAVSVGVGLLFLLLGQLLLAGLEMVGVILPWGLGVVNLVSLLAVFITAGFFAFIGPIVVLEETKWKNPLPALRKSFDFVKENLIDSFFIFIDFGILLALASLDSRLFFPVLVVSLPCLAIAVTAFYVDLTGAGFHRLDAPAAAPVEKEKAGDEKATPEPKALKKDEKK